MSKGSIALLAVAACAIGFSFHGERRSPVGAIAAEERPRAKDRPEWEYKVVEYGYGDKDLKAREKAFTDSFNKLGKDGWEYCGPLANETVIETKATGFPSSAGARSFVVFKRPRK
jgi:hypothetical protein